MTLADRTARPWIPPTGAKNVDGDDGGGTLGDGGGPRLRIGASRETAAEAAVVDIGGRQIAWFRLAGGAHRGALGPTEGEMISQLVRRAVELGIPVVGLVASSGADVSNGIASLHAWGRVAAELARASGVVPVGLVVAGPCVSGPALLLGLADIVIMTEDSFAYVSGPDAVAGFTGVSVPRDLLGGSAMHARRSGLASLVVPDEQAALDEMFAVLSYLPANNLEDPPHNWHGDPPDRPASQAAAAVPTTPTAPYDCRLVVRDVCDTDSFLELRPGYATNMVTGLATVGGSPVGVVANQPCQRAGTLDIEASRKAARFVQWCDAFNLPVVTFVDTPGFEPGKDLEWRGMIRHGAELVVAYAESTVPRICVIVRKAYGGAYIVMDSKTLGNDLCVAWPNAEIAVLGAPAAIQILYGRRMASGEISAEQRVAIEAEYAATYCTATIAAQRGYVDEVIDPSDTRRVVVDAVRLLHHKRDTPPRRRHTNSPL